MTAIARRRTPVAGIEDQVLSLAAVFVAASIATVLRSARAIHVLSARAEREAGTWEPFLRDD